MSSSSSSSSSLFPAGGFDTVPPGRTRTVTVPGPGLTIPTMSDRSRHWGVLISRRGGLETGVPPPSEQDMTTLSRSKSVEHRLRLRCSWFRTTVGTEACRWRPGVFAPFSRTLPLRFPARSSRTGLSEQKNFRRMRGVAVEGLKRRRLRSGASAAGGFSPPASTDIRPTASLPLPSESLPLPSESLLLSTDSLLLANKSLVPSSETLHSLRSRPKGPASLCDPPGV
mmetsp:Transcript_32936/g.92236  ORF Transcript_32936/g.92236 Transcript_32936/m.92236 type:complete len:226 (-) Transcript_32936:340-1017(-)